MAFAVKSIVFSLSRWHTASLRLLRPRGALRSVHGALALSLAVTRTPPPGWRQYTAGAELRLLSCVQEEVDLEQGLTEQLPEVAGFDATISGCLATLHRQYGNEKVMVELDTHHAVEVMPDELGEEGQMEEEEEEEGEPFFVPAFTVTVTNSSGSQLQVDCSFDEHGHYVEQGNEWDNLTIYSVSVIAPDSQDADSVYTVSANNLSTELYESLLGYLQERGINPSFAVEVIQFYRVHEHRCYVEHSLKALRNFLHAS